MRLHTSATTLLISSDLSDRSLNYHFSSSCLLVFKYTFALPVNTSQATYLLLLSNTTSALCAQYTPDPQGLLSSYDCTSITVLGPDLLGPTSAARRVIPSWARRVIPSIDEDQVQHRRQDRTERGSRRIFAPSKSVKMSELSEIIILIQPNLNASKIQKTVQYSTLVAFRRLTLNIPVRLNIIRIIYMLKDLTSP